MSELDKATKSAFYLSQTWNANRSIMRQDLLQWIQAGADIRSSLKQWAEMIG